MSNVCLEKSKTTDRSVCQCKLYNPEKTKKNLLAPHFFPHLEYCSRQTMLVCCGIMIAEGSMLVDKSVILL